MSQNDLVAICKSKVTLTLKKPACVQMCILDLSKVLMCGFHYDYIKNKYGKNARLLFWYWTLMYGIKIEDVYEYFSGDKEMFDFDNYLTKSKYSQNSIKQTNLVQRKLSILYRCSPWEGFPVFLCSQASWMILNTPGIIFWFMGLLTFIHQ